jgi:hypothetical protein
MRSLVALIVPPVLLAACAAGPGSFGSDQPTGPYYGAPAGSYTGPQATYTCEDLTTVLVQPGVGIATATLNSGMELRLVHRGGGLYGLQTHNFRQRGNDGVWVVEGRPPRACRLVSRSQ